MHSLLDDGACQMMPTDGLYSDCVVGKTLMEIAQVEHRVGLMREVPQMAKTFIAKGIS